MLRSAKALLRTGLPRDPVLLGTSFPRVPMFLRRDMCRAAKVLQQAGRFRRLPLSRISLNNFGAADVRRSAMSSVAAAMICHPERLVGRNGASHPEFLGKWTGPCSHLVAS